MLILIVQQKVSLDKPIETISMPVLGNITKIMKGFKYEYSDNEFDAVEDQLKAEILYVFYRSCDQIYAEKYRAYSGETLHIELPSVEEFYVSLHENSLILYHWDVMDAINLDSLHDFIITPNQETKSSTENKIGIIYGWSEERRVFKFEQDDNSNGGVIKFAYRDRNGHIAQWVKMKVQYNP